MKDGLRIVGWTTLLAVIYGIAHDMVTAHVAVDYFTKYHPHLVGSTNPVVMALLWGIIATWWFGAAGGVLLAVAAGVGRAPRITPKRVAAATAKALALVYLLAMGVLVGVYEFAQTAPDKTPDWDTRSRLVAVAVTHAFSYNAAAVAALLVATRILLLRLKPPSARRNVHVMQHGRPGNA